MFKILSLIQKGDARSVKAKKNVLVSTFIKGADTLVYLLLVPLTLGYLNAYEYGIWITLSSILSWINSFDIGLGSGLRNKLAIAIAEDDKEKGRIYVSTTLYMLIVLTTFLFLLSIFVVHQVDWYQLLNADKSTVRDIEEVIIASLLFFCLNFILKFIGNVYQALQLPAVNYLIVFCGHLLSLVIIFVLTRTIPGSLFWVAIAYSAAPPVVYLCCYPITFNKIFPYLSPSVRFFRKEYIRDLLSLSVSFFMLQIMGVVLFSLSNILISNMFGPDQVTPYNIAYRYFSIISMLFSLLLAPVWSATTDAYAKGELSWIGNCVEKISRIMGMVMIVILLMIVVSPIFYGIWVGTEVEIPILMTVAMGAYMFVFLWSMAFSAILNGMGKLRIQILTIICVACLYFPVCSYLGKQIGVLGVIVGMLCLNIPGAILNTVQLHRIVKNRAFGIWNK